MYGLDPADVAEVHAVGQEVVLRIHTETKLHTAGIVELIGQFEEQMRTFGLNELERFYLIEFIVIMGRGADGYEVHAEALIIEGLGIEFNGYAEGITYVEVGDIGFVDSTTSISSQWAAIFSFQAAISLAVL